MVLHGYWRSGPSWRVRIALHWKGLAFEQRPVNLLAHAQSAPGHVALNPQGRIPVLEADNVVLIQSPAILEWLEETHPSPPLLPADPLHRARVRALCALIACDVTPLQNLAVGRELKTALGADDGQVEAWRATWNTRGLTALQALAADRDGAFLHGDAPGMAEVYLIPQLYAARRFGVDMAAFGRLTEIEARCADLSAFQAALPEHQPDAVRPM